MVGWSYDIFLHKWANHIRCNIKHACVFLLIIETKKKKRRKKKKEKQTNDSPAITCLMARNWNDHSLCIYAIYVCGCVCAQSSVLSFDNFWFLPLSIAEHDHECGYCMFISSPCWQSMQWLPSWFLVWFDYYLMLFEFEPRPKVSFCAS